MLTRELNLPKEQNFFLLGPRQTGKTTLIRAAFAGKLKEINLLLSDTFRAYAAHPEKIREELKATPDFETHVLIDEVQRIPELLNEVQALIDGGFKQKFILSGSSARKLKRGHANLLGGRAWSYRLFPLTFPETPPSLSLERVLSCGLIPKNVLCNDTDAQENLRSYVDIYLKEEIEAEALSRNIGGFIRFLKTAAQSNAEQLNFSNIADDVGLSSVTIKEYFKILEDTLIGAILPAYAYSERKRHKTAPKFYFFDTGVLRAIQGKVSVPLEQGTFDFGNCFETMVINEAQKISSYLRKDFQLSFLRTAGDVEVDLLIETPRGELFAVEIKSKKRPVAMDFGRGFAAIRDLRKDAKCICVSTTEVPLLVEGEDVLPYAKFFEMLRAL